VEKFSAAGFSSNLAEDTGVQLPKAPTFAEFSEDPTPSRS